MQDYKRHRLCIVATLAEMIERMDKKMKNVQIPQEMFLAIIRFFLLDQTELQSEIQAGLEHKVETMAMRELYTKYKTASSAEERQKARQEYLDRRGVPENFRM